MVLTIIFLLLYNTSFGQDINFPKEQYRQYDLNIETNYKNDSLNIKITNPVRSPIRFVLKTTNKIFNEKYHLNDTILILPLEKRILKFEGKIDDDTKFSYSSFLGNPYNITNKNKLGYPFPKGRKYKIIQGYNGKYSHNNDYNRFALDFDLNVNDTICSADDGIIVGLIEDYKFGGNTQIWRENDRSNFITIYHPHSGVYTQYVHLIYKGSLVKLGDEVKKGQVIAISGITGFTDTPHLHFNVLIPKKGYGLISIPAVFENDLQGKNLRIGSLVTHQII